MQIGLRMYVCMYIYIYIYIYIYLIRILLLGMQIALCSHSSAIIMRVQSLGLCMQRVHLRDYPQQDMSRMCLQR
jgi:hypothetical protein